MLKTIKKSFLAVVLAVATLFALTSCVITGGGQTTTDPTLDAQAALSEFTEQVTFANTAEVTTSFNLPAAGKKGSYQIPITWTSNNEAVIAVTDLVEGGTTSTTHKKASVTRPAVGSEDVTVTLTAEFSLTYTKNDGTSATLKETKTYNFTVLKETSEIAGGTLAEIKDDAAKFYFVDNGVNPGTSSAKELEFPVEFDATVTVVLGADGAGQFAVSDGTAGIYVYSNKTAVNVGDKVHVKGSITVYYGTLQVGANIEVTPATFNDQTIEFKPATPGSINAMSTADGMYGGQTLKVSGTLLFGKYNNGSSDSFWLEDALTGSQIELYYKSFTAAEKEALQAYAGKYVEMDVVTYDTYSSSAPNDHRVFALPSTVKEATAPEVGDADKVASAVAKANAASLKDVYYNGDEFAFPVIDVAEGVNIEWSIEPAAVLVDGKLVITAAGTATLKAVVTCGTLTETVTLTMNLDVEVPALDTGDFEEDTPYYIVATNGNGDLHFNGTVTDGRFNGKYTTNEAVKVYVEKADNGLYIYFLDGTTKTYIVMGDSSTGCAFTTDKANATIFEYNATVDTLVVAEDSNNRAFGVGATSTYDNFSAYDISNTYNWGKFVKADGTTEPEEHTHTECPTCGLCTAKDCDGTAEEKCAGHYVEPEVANKTVAELIALTTEMDAKYTVTGKVVLWGNKLTSTDVAPGQYGNFVLEGEDGSKIVVYGATATASALTFDTTTGKYTYVNPKDFLTNELTSTIAVGDTVELVVVRTSFNSNPQLNAIVTKVTKAEPEEHTHTECPTCGLCTAEDCDGTAEEKCAGHYVEPEVANKTVAELIALTTEMDAKYTVTGKVVLWGNKLTSTDVAPGQYGNFVLEGEDGSKIVVYGATATASALTFDTTTGKYTYVNPKDFLTNELTSTIAVGDTVELVVVRTSFNSNPQLNAIVTKVTKAEPGVPTDAEKLAEAKEALVLDVTEATENITLPATGLNDVVITWASNNEAIATDGTVTRGATDVEVTLTATLTLGEATDTKEFTVVVKAAEQEQTEKFVKVTSSKEDWSGTYLIVYEEGLVALNGSLTTVDAVSNTSNVTISESLIEASDALKAVTVVITKESDGTYTIKTASGVYIGQTANSNGLKSSGSTKYYHNITINDDGTINIISVNGGTYLRYNAAADQTRFRYYKASSYANQKAICLYELA